MQAPSVFAEAVRACRAQALPPRDRDFADAPGHSEAALVAANCGQGVTQIDAHPDAVTSAAQKLGEVMALTRNTFCLKEKIGVYGNARPGQHAAIILAEGIDLRVFPNHFFWLSTKAIPALAAACWCSRPWGCGKVPRARRPVTRRIL